MQLFSAKRTRKPTVLCDGKSNQVKICIEKKKRATALIYGGKANKRPAWCWMFDTLKKRCKLSDLTNYISNASNLPEGVASNTYSKSKGKFEISEENITIRSIPGYDNVIGSERIRLCSCFSDKTQQKKAWKENLLVYCA